MKKLLENLKEAIKHYEIWEDFCTAEHIMAESIMQLGRCCKEVNEECQVMFSTMLNDN